MEFEIMPINLLNAQNFKISTNSPKEHCFKKLLTLINELNVPFVQKSWPLKFKI